MAEQKKIECRILRDTWDEDGNRHRKGSVISLDPEHAMDALEAGAVERVKKASK